ncbi:LysR family transcriptional regulator [Acidovorax sp. 106]|uniref:LysR family transcriptional regulator n=1 Tax=Acidovorax sp. 106 TaxID=2135637 RepID=UPI000EAD8BA3|nr:LysR family transcriptional regulator [Acidovorax sp. 106]RLJ39020.1 DNA-binding transcriptional LysR family regulator [Acidovorax sp. 106]
MSKHPSTPTAAEPPPAHRAPTLRQLRSFQAVARAMSFRQAAEALSLTQPALSASIRELETVLGTPVLERSTHHVRLTPQGALLLPQVERLLNGYEQGVDGLFRTLHDGKRVLRVAALPSAMHLLAEPLRQWLAQHPVVDLRLYDPLNDDLLAALQRGEVDLALGVALDLPPQIDAIAVAQDDLVAVLPVGHRLAHRARLTWQDLAGERLALFARGSTYELAMATLRQNGADLARADQLLYSESLYSLVRCGLAVGVISRLYTHNLHDGAVKVCPLQAPVISRKVALMVHAAQDARAPLVQSCLEFLTQALRKA